MTWNDGWPPLWCVDNLRSRLLAEVCRQVSELSTSSENGIQHYVKKIIHSISFLINGWNHVPSASAPSTWFNIIEIEIDAFSFSPMDSQLVNQWFPYVSMVHLGQGWMIAHSCWAQQRCLCKSMGPCGWCRHGRRRPRPAHDHADGLIGCFNMFQHVLICFNQYKKNGYKKYNIFVWLEVRSRFVSLCLVSTKC